MLQVVISGQVTAVRRAGDKQTPDEYMLVELREKYWSGGETFFRFHVVVIKPYLMKSAERLCQLEKWVGFTASKVSFSPQYDWAKVEYSTEMQADSIFIL